jgi:hypothetical protein
LIGPTPEGVPTARGEGQSTAGEKQTGERRGSRRTGQKQVSLFQLHDARDVLDQLRNTVEHELCRVRLLGLAVDLFIEERRGGKGRKATTEKQSAPVVASRKSFSSSGLANERGKWTAEGKAAHLVPQLECVRIRDFLLRDELADGAEGVEAL